MSLLLAHVRMYMQFVMRILKEANIHHILAVFLKLLWKILFSVMFTVGAALATLFGISYATYGGLGITLYVVCCALLSLVISLIMFVLKNRELFDHNPQYDRKLMVDSLKQELRNFLSRKEFNDVERFGGAISRVLWLCGEYKSRVELGKMVFEAATHLNHHNTRAKVLIDDIGWTYITLDKKDLAIQNISKGIELAQDNALWKLVVKGHRHLAGIHMLNTAVEKNRTEALRNLGLASNTIEKINGPQIVGEMSAGIEYAYSEYYYQTGDHPQALTRCKKARSDYNKSNDSEREVKTFSQMGKIFLAEREYENAKHEFMIGLGKAESTGRYEEIIKNHMGLFICYDAENDPTNSRAHFIKCEEYLRDLDVQLYGWNQIIETYKSKKEYIRR